MLGLISRSSGAQNKLGLRAINMWLLRSPDPSGSINTY